MDFEEYRDNLVRFYNEKRYSEALQVAVKAAEQFPDRKVKSFLWIACLQSRLGDHDKALRTIDDAVKAGIFWSDQSLQDPDLDPIRGRTEFRAIEIECKSLRRERQTNAKPELLVKVPKISHRETESPALITFHQRYGERPEFSAKQWLSVLSRDIILAAPWSSQVYAADGRCWDNLELAEKDAKWAYSELKARHQVDSDRVILSGLSQGAALAIDLALKRLVPCRGFIAVAPSDWVVPEEKRALERTHLSEPFASIVKASDCRGLRGAIIIGDKDPFLSKIEQLYEIMIQKGLTGQLTVEKNLGHEYPEHFEQNLKAAVDFVIGIR